MTAPAVADTVVHRSHTARFARLDTQILLSQRRACRTARTTVVVKNRVSTLDRQEGFPSG
ncbi:hypothetical protein [Streptomyces sp. NPDC088733]|uniref:hypothetical protein n=1 Tax=Streptomyces sp. NPDC088733 TaxID=3365880 RepID=UPI00380D8A02